MANLGFDTEGGTAAEVNYIKVEIVFLVKDLLLQ